MPSPIYTKKHQLLEPKLNIVVERPLIYIAMNKQIQDLKVPAHLQDKFEEEIRVEIIRQQTEEELRSQSVYQEFFKQFNPHSVDSFIKNYAQIGRAHV